MTDRAEDASGPMVGGDVEVGLARFADAEAIAVLSREVIEAGLPWKWQPRSIAREILRKDTEVIVARLKGQVVGAAIMRFDDEEAHLFLLGVLPEHQHKGIGRRLLEWLEKCVRTAGIETVRLQVRERNQVARDFYRALGYAEIAVLRHYYGKENAVVMMNWLSIRPRGEA